MSLLPRTDTNLSMVPPPTCHQNIPHQPLNIEGFGVDFFCLFSFWLSLFGFLTSEASHEELEKSSVGGGKKKPPRQVLHGTSRDSAGCPACQHTEFWQFHPACKTSVSLVRLAPNACWQEWHYQYTAQNQTPLQAQHPDNTASFWQRMPCYFGIKRLKKHERNGVEIVPGMFWMLSTHIKMSMVFFRRTFNFFLNKSCLKHSEIKDFLWKEKGAKQCL